MNSFIHITHIESKCLLCCIGAIGDINRNSVTICCLMIETTGYFDLSA